MAAGQQAHSRTKGEICARLQCQVLEAKPAASRCNSDRAVHRPVDVGQR